MVIGRSNVQNRFGVEVESGHEHHTNFNYKGIMVENYYDFIKSQVHRDALAIEAKLKEFVDKKIFVCTISDMYLLSVDFNVIFLIRHLGQHLAGEYITLR